MSQISRITLQRLRHLPKFPGLWEGDRRPLSSAMAASLNGAEAAEALSMDCILWVDGMQGELRSMAVVPAESGYEPLVRTLLQAMESPQGGQAPARPKKILVRDREVQFYLRGALQELDITVEFAPSLPLIDSLFEAFADIPDRETEEIPEAYAEALMAKAIEIWDVAPWNVLNEQQILAIEIKGWDIDTLYISVLGMGGVDYGLLMYRSLDSLKQFRQQVLKHENSPNLLQEAFLEQDCLYLNFEFEGAAAGPAAMPGLRWLNPPPERIRPDFGSLHPLEGMRTEIAAEEAIVLLIAMEGLRRFFDRYYETLEDPPFETLEGRYRVPNPDLTQSRKTHTVTVKTLPEVTAALEAETQQIVFDQMGSNAFPVLRDDFVPEGSFVMLVKLPPVWIDFIQRDPLLHYQSTDPLPTEDLPVVLIQTTRPKAKALIQDIQKAQGMESVVFNTGRDSFSGETFELGLLHTGEGVYQLFGEYQQSDPSDRRVLDHWRKWVKDSKGVCGVVIACGVTGKAQGKPGLKEMLGFFSARARTAEELHLPPLQLNYAMDFGLE